MLHSKSFYVVQNVVVNFGIAEKREAIDAKIGEHAKGWKTQRLTNVSRSVLRLGVYEMLYEDAIPYSVSSKEVR